MIGWLMALPPPARRWLILALCLMATVAQGAPEPSTPQEEPDADFLDFLGAWQNEDGRWVDPFQLAEELPTRAPTELKTDRPSPGTGSRKPSRGNQPNPAPDTPRDPMRMQTGP